MPATYHPNASDMDITRVGDVRYSAAIDHESAAINRALMDSQSPGHQPLLPQVRPPLLVLLQVPPPPPRPAPHRPPPAQRRVKEWREVMFDDLALPVWDQNAFRWDDRVK
jgi:hypothetical protein